MAGEVVRELIKNLAKDFASEILFVSLVFVAVLSVLALFFCGVHSGVSFLIGAGVSLFDVYALARFLRSMFASGSGWMYAPLSILRWGLVGVVLFLAFYYYGASPLFLLAGVALPFLCILCLSVYKLFRGNRNGASS